MGNDERTSEGCTKRPHENQTVLHALRNFLEQRNNRSESAAADRQKELPNEMHTIRRESPQRRTRNLQKLVDRKVQQLDQVTVRQNQQYECSKLVGKMGKVHGTGMSQRNALLKNEPGYLFENSKITEILKEIFTGKHLTKLNLDNTFYDSMNEEVEQLSVQAGEQTHFCNDPLSWQGRSYAFTQLPSANKASDTNNVHSKMLKKSEPSFKELTLQLFNKSLEDEIWPWETRKSKFFGNQGKRTTSHFRHNAPSQDPATWENYSNALELRIRAFAEQERSLDNEQERFRKHKNTGRLFYRPMLKCKNLTARKRLGALISLNFDEAFYSVWLNGLVWKLKNIGISGNLFGVLTSLLENRSLYIGIGDHKSETFRSNIGVPQGAILPPSAFIVFVSEMVCGKPGELFEFVNNGNLLLSADTKVKLDGQTRTTLLKSF